MTRSEFRSLQREWYGRLAASGFKDIETLLPSGEMGALLSHFNPHEHTPETLQARYDYYARLRQFAHEYPFPDRSYRTIYECYGEGMTFREIARKLKRDVRSVHQKFTRLKPIFLEWCNAS